jgi:hypothetical protein
MRWLIALFFLTGAVFAQSQQPSPSDRVLSDQNQPKASNQNTQPAADQRGTENSPIIIKIAPGPNAQEEAAQAKRIKKEKAMADSRAEIITYVVVGATVIQAVALIITIFVMVRNGRRQLRAYVSLDGGSIRIISDNQGNKFVEGFVNLKNCGQTPARNCKSWVQIKIDNIGNPPFDQKSYGKGASIIGPGTPFNLPVHYPLTAVDLAAIRSESKRIYVWGETEYIDVFNYDRFFKFYQWNGIEIPGKGWPLEVSDKPQEAN